MIVIIELAILIVVFGVQLFYTNRIDMNMMKLRKEFNIHFNDGLAEKINGILRRERNVKRGDF